MYDRSNTYGAHLLEDALERVRFQQQATLSGFKTLTLMNGAAAIALLTYAGNLGGQHIAGQLTGAFVSYAVGLATTAGAYICAYFAQDSFAKQSDLLAREQLGLAWAADAAPAHKTKGMRWHGVSAALAIVGALSFVSGSVFATKAVTSADTGADRALTSSPTIEAAPSPILLPKSD